MANLRAIALMTLSMAFFAVGDALVKISTQALSVGQVILVMALIGTAIFAALSWRAGQPLMAPAFRHPVIVTRNIIEGLTAIFMVTALSLAPVSLVISIAQAVPLLVTMGGALLLGEKVGPRRWGAVLVGLCGVLVILRPGGSENLLGPLLALIAACGLAARDLCTRLAPSEVGTLQMAHWGMLSILPAGLVMLPVTGAEPVTVSALTPAVLAALATAAGYFAITAAMRLGEVSAVAPFRYSRLLFALFLAVLFLGERPDFVTILGAMIVIGSGLFVLLRERQLYRRDQTGQ